ncbi:MAG: SDR family NAD(P)-dependent oxidoreductase [Anaerolineaceae bacterium]|nr:SDR family NAD(P)-dependent oxidoreductase [Anaerolineaceae bacterium]
MAKMIALITGAGKGIGLEVARQLGQKGFTVILGVRDLAKGESAAVQLKGEGLDVVAKVADVADDHSVKQLASAIETDYGQLDILVNNAAAYVDWMETASTAKLESVLTVLETNLFGAWRMTQALLPLLHKSQHPRVVNVSSGAGSHGEMQFGLTTNKGASASYGISKAALNALTVKFAVELEGTGILVNAVCPGLTATAPGMEAMGARPIPEGAASVVWATLLPDDGPTGGFFRDGKTLPW